MNIHQLREAQARYENELDTIKKIRKPLYALRSSFVKHFNENEIIKMPINDYVIGVPHLPDSFNFCYGLERRLDGLGRIIGATAFKFGIYYGRIKSDANDEYRFANKFGSNKNDAFTNVKHSLLDLIENGRIKNLDLLAKNNLSPMFKGKILSTYFPDKYLNVFSDDHLSHFLVQLDLDTKKLMRSDPIFKREALVKFKNEDIVMKDWSIDLFANFLYNEYPGRPINEKATKPSILDDYTEPIFPPNPEASFIKQNILPFDQTKGSQQKVIRGKKDYEAEARKNKKLGDRGEKIVMDIEDYRLKNLGREDLAKKIKRVSLESDSYGYDILSFEENGEERYIEVKATTAKTGHADFFYTANEFTTAQKLDNYFIYMVYDVTSSNPKIWPIANPFNPENKDVVKIPVNYKVSIKTEPIKET